MMTTDEGRARLNAAIEGGHGSRNYDRVVRELSGSVEDMATELSPDAGWRAAANANFNTLHVLYQQLARDYAEMERIGQSWRRRYEDLKAEGEHRQRMAAK